MFTLEATLPAVVSVTEKINEPRFPSFKGIMAAKKKEVTVLTLAEIGVESDEVGLDNAGSTVLSSTPKPPKTAGEKVTDEGEGGNDRSPSTWSPRRSSRPQSQPKTRRAK